jgi:hypothetical protein
MNKTSATIARMIRIVQSMERPYPVGETAKQGPDGVIHRRRM